MEQSETKRPYKYAALVTYVIVVVCLLLGFFVPLFDGKNILALQLPGIFNGVIGKDLLKFGKTFTLPCPIYFLGMKKTVDIAAWTLFMYFIVTVFAIISLIPVIIGTVKNHKIASIFAYIVECAAVLVLSVYLAVGIQLVPEVKLSYNLLIPLCGSLLMLIVLNCINKKASGAVKTVLLFLSAIAFLMLFNYVAANAKLGEFLTKLGDKTKTSPLFFGAAEAGEDSAGIDYLTLLFASPDGALKEAFSIMPDAKNKAVLALAIITSTVVLLNYFIDVIGLSTNAKRVGRVFNVARYLIELLSVICLFITLAVCKYKIGVLLIVVSFAAAIRLTICTVLLIKDLLKNRKPAEETDVSSYFKAEPAPAPAEEALPAPEPALATEPAPAPKNEYILNPYISSPPPTTEYSQSNPFRVKTDTYPPEEPMERYTPAPVPEKPKYTSTVSYEPANDYTPPKIDRPSYYAPAENPIEPPVIEQTRVYKVNTLYQGPTDEFMKKLTNDEKVEFSMAFIERSKGAIGNVPDYIIGGDNRKFFSAVFIYLGRIRGLVSDSLLNKMYKELNML